MRRSPSFKDVAGELANDESQVWPIEVDKMGGVVDQHKVRIAVVLSVETRHVRRSEAVLAAKNRERWNREAGQFLLELGIAWRTNEPPDQRFLL